MKKNIIITLIIILVVYMLGIIIINYNYKSRNENFANEFINIDSYIGGKKTIDMVDEFRRLRFMLDKYDTEAIEHPYDKEVLRKRSELEHLLTKIVLYVRKYGQRAYVRDLERMIMQFRLILNAGFGLPLISTKSILSSKSAILSLLILKLS
jgi:hypothetical protein